MDIWDQLAETAKLAGYVHKPRTNNTSKLRWWFPNTGSEHVDSLEMWLSGFSHCKPYQQLDFTSVQTMLYAIDHWVRKGVLDGPRDEERMRLFTAELYDRHTSGEGGVDLTDAYGEQHSLICYCLLMSTAHQMREALLRAAGVWKHLNGDVSDVERKP